MATTISVNKQNVLELLSTGRAKPFVVPEYQRPYAWTDEQIETLFEDIWEFATTIGGLKNSGSYFLGSIVSFENENGEQEIIDGQQRITSLFLLLRAIYTKLIKGDDANTDAARNFIGKIEPAIWRTDNLTGKVDYSDILLTSKVVDNAGNEILRKILETGEADIKADDNYSKNYLQFQKLYDKHCSESPLQIYDFIYALLNQAILLPIGADSQDTALTIFSTLNNRGLPLSDADIFKAKIYNHLKEEEKECFIAQWKSLEKEAAEANESIQRLFYYYMFFLRAKEGDVSSTTPGVRKYYLAGKCERLYDSELMNDLSIVLGLWKVINTNHDIPEETWDNNPKIRKALDTLVSYPNEYWKYPVIIYYLAHRKDVNFDEEFLLFLNKLAGELMTRFILFPTINAVKADIMKLNAKIIKDTHPQFDFRPIDIDAVKDRIKIAHRNIVRMLLKSYAYNHQEELLPDNWQIEHILPQKWQSSFFPVVEPKVVNDMIEHIGNKTPFEKKLNIIASNGYFKKKQTEYQKSDIEVTRILVTSIDNDWTLGNIEHRDEIITQEVMKLLDNWELQYQNYKGSSKEEGPSAEELEQIEKFKKMGWI
jgi:hypothetical protein